MPKDPEHPAFNIPPSPQLGYGDTLPRKMGGLGILDDRYVREFEGDYYYTPVRMTEGWGLATSRYIRGNIPQDPKALAFIATKIGVIARSLITRRLLPMAAVTEVFAVLTPLPGDELANPLLMTTLAIGGVMGIAKERRRLQGNDSNSR